MVHVLHGVLELEAIGPGPGHLAAHLRPGRREVRQGPAATAAFLIATRTWYGSLSNWTSKSPSFTR